MNSNERHEARYRRRAMVRKNKKTMRQETFEGVFTFDRMYQSYKKRCKGVRWKPSTQLYSSNAIKNVRRKQLELLEGKERTRGFVEFDICDRGKQRHIMSCHISDRVVQRTLCDYCLVPQMSKTFIYDNAASLPGRGIDFAINRMNTHLHRFYREHNSNDGYVLQIDFKSYFDNLSHETARREIARSVLDMRLRMRAYACLDCYGEKGVGLGAMSSQVIALAVPNEIDHYIKERLHARYYGRYNDDSYIVHESKEYLQVCLREILGKCNQLGIPVNMKKTHITKVRRFRFLKMTFILTKTGAVIRRPNRKAFKRLRSKMRTFRRWVTSGRMAFADVVASVSSWLGCIMRSRAYFSIKRAIRYFKTLFSEELQLCSTLPKTMC